jgi:hypothetical protein
LAAVIVGALAASAAPASAATTIGQTFTPTIDCGNPDTWTQSSSPTAGPSYAAPTAGVITSWSNQAVAVAETIKLKVARRAGGPDDFTIVGQSGVQTMTPNTLNTFPTRIPVRAGDTIGFFHSGGPCGVAAPGAATRYANPEADVGPGPTQTYLPGLASKLDVSAQLEPDADDDGFGDETQDQCPTDVTRQTDCAPPDTTITQQPKAKTTKKKATFAFTSSEANSTFECSVDGAAYAPCTSPATFKVAKGNHTLSVRAKDAAGNLDPTPATATWKYKKKKK